MRTQRPPYAAWLVLLAIVLSLVTPILIPSDAHANAAEPPSLVIYVFNAPEDLALELVDANGQALAGDSSRFSFRASILDHQYALYDHRASSAGELFVKVSHGDTSFVTKIKKPQRYVETYHLDLRRQTIKDGKGLLRTVVFIGLRLGITLLVEGLIFLLFGFRHRRSWLIWLVVNLATQALLNGYLQMSHRYQYGAILVILFLEVIIFVAETLAFVRLLREHSKNRATVYAVVANAASLALGFFLIPRLPF